MDITALQNLTPLEINNSLLNNSAEMGANLLENANTTSQGYLGLVFMITLFIFLFIILNADQDIFRLDMIKALLVSSGLVTIVGIIALISGIFTNFTHVMWFAVIFTISLIGNYFNNKGT